MKDLLAGCMSDIPEKLSTTQFQELFCVFCRNPDCRHARWKEDLFSARVSTQVEKLFGTPQINQTDIAGYTSIANFKDLLAKAIRLEIADRRGDWTIIPEIPILDGVTEQSSAATASSIEEATKMLAQTRGYGEIVEEKDDPQIEEELEVPESQESEGRESEGPSINVLAQETITKIPQGNNTYVPSTGIIIGGGPAPMSSQVKAQPAIDPWSVESGTVRIVKPGAKIQLGGPPNDK